MLNIFSCYCPFWYLLWKDDFSNSLPIFSWFTDLFIKFFRVLSTLRLLHSYQLHNLSMISSYSVGRLFTFFDRILWYTEGSDYDEVQFFLLITCAFDVILCLPNPRSYRFTPIFLSKSFTVLTLTFGVLYPFWINFCIWCDGVKFHSVDIQFSQYYYWRDCWFSTECSWNSCQKSKIDHLYEGFFWVLSSISLIYMSVLMPHCCVCMCVLATQSCLTFCDLMDGMEPTRLLYPWDSSGKDTGLGCHSLLQGIFPTQGSNPDLPHCTPILLPSEPPVESFEIGKFKSSTFVLLFQDCVGYLESHKFTYKF